MQKSVLFIFFVAFFPTTVLIVALLKIVYYKHPLLFEGELSP